MKLGIIKINTKVGKPFATVKQAFVNKDAKLLKYLLPIGSELLHYKGIRRGAIIKVKVFGVPCKFKVITYSVGKSSLYFNDIMQEGTLLGTKYWSHRHKIKKLSDNETVIIDEITFTSTNKYKDFILHVLFLSSFAIRSLQYKTFFLKEK